jgi:hypothetical protein
MYSLHDGVINSISQVAPQTVGSPKEPVGCGDIGM